MTLQRTLLAAFVLALAAWLLPPQSRAQVVLEISPSPPQTAMGGLGVALPVTDAHGFFYNPAQLGHFGRKANVAVRGYPVRAAWQPDFWDDFAEVDDLSTRSTALSVGRDFSASLGVPLSAGIGYARSSFEFGTSTLRSAENEIIAIEDASDRSDAFSAGIGFGGLVAVSAGATYKRVRLEGLATRGGDATAAAFDMGVLASALLVGDGPSLTGLEGRLGNALSLDVELSLGYAALNVGGELEETPLPRAARLGYGLTAGLGYDLGGEQVRLVEVMGSVEAEDRLLASASNTADGFAYQGPFGDIAPLDNIVLMRGSDEVTRRRGAAVELGETLQFRRGGFDGGGYAEESTRGWGVRAQGALKVLAAGANTPVLNVLAAHLDLRYFAAAQFHGGERETDFHSLSLVVRGF